MFGIGMTNPALTMAVSENFWRCTHYGPMLAEPPQRGFRYRENSVEARIVAARRFRPDTCWWRVPQSVMGGMRGRKGGHQSVDCSGGRPLHPQEHLGWGCGPRSMHQLI